MIASIIVGSGNDRKVVPTGRTNEDRTSIARAIKGFLFPTAEINQRAMAKGQRRAAEYRRARRAAVA